jgi:GNAT superfamily N-acetyltransferase
MTGRHSGADTGRVEPSSTVEVVAATAERWDDVVALLGGDSERGCWCQAWRGSTAAFGRAEAGANRRALEAQLRATPPPGMLAYAEGTPVGWCGFGVRPELPRLARSRTIPAIDDRPVWAIGCFVVRAGYRRRGVARALLDGVVALAREMGAPGVEAYPIDPAGDRVNVSAGFVGFVGMFERAGFRRIVETAARSDRRPRWLMRLDFPGTGS